MQSEQLLPLGLKGIYLAHVDVNVDTQPRHMDTKLCTHGYMGTSVWIQDYTITLMNTRPSIHEYV
jgi:hypothetical protein